MTVLTPFIVLIERRRLKQRLSWLMASLFLAAGLATHAEAAAGEGKSHRKIARDLAASVDAPDSAPSSKRWERRVRGQRMVDAVVVGDGSDPELRSLRRFIERQGGTVNARFSSVNALSVTMPARAVRRLEKRDDVENAPKG